MSPVDQHPPYAALRLISSTTQKLPVDAMACHFCDKQKHRAVYAGRQTPLFDLATSACALPWSTMALIASCSSAAGLLTIWGRSISTPTSTTCSSMQQHINRRTKQVIASWCTLTTCLLKPSSKNGSSTLLACVFTLVVCQAYVSGMHVQACTARCMRLNGMAILPMARHYSQQHSLSTTMQITAAHATNILQPYLYHCVQERCL